MTKYILLIAAAAFLYINKVHGQDFKATLQKTFTTFDTTKDMQVRKEYSNKLGLISKKWTEEWASHYYNALSKTILSYNEPDEAKRDAYLDEAERERDEAVTLLKKEDDETYVLAAMIANARMAVKPQARWLRYRKLLPTSLCNSKRSLISRRRLSLPSASWRSSS